MEGDAEAHYCPPQESLAAQMLSKLQGTGDLTTVTVPEGYTLHASGPSMVSGTSPVLNPSLAASSLSRISVPDGVILSSASGLDPALTQLLVAAQAGGASVNRNAASNLISDVSSILPQLPLNQRSTSHSQTLHPILSASLALPPAQGASGNTAILLPQESIPPDPPPPDQAPPETPSMGSMEGMTITVQCTMSDTVIVVGQQIWQCCMCRQTYGFDVSVDQHLSLKHNLHITPPPVTTLHPQDAVTTQYSTITAPSGLAHSDTIHGFADDKSLLSPSPSSLQVVPDKSLKPSDSSRSGLEREVALLMAQTFTHSGEGSLTNQETDKANTLLNGLESSEKHNDSADLQCLTSSDDMNRSVTLSLTEPLAVSDTNGAETGAVNVFGKMINKVERAMRSTSDSDARNDLLLVATELARMRKEATSKRSKMKKNHRYITCSECGKEVRNRRDLIKQHNRCHETSKNFRCLVCNKLFKYLHTLRRHVLQQAHHGGMPADVPPSPTSHPDGSQLSSAGNSSESVKAELAGLDEGQTLPAVSFSPPSSENKAASSESKGHSETKPSTESSTGGQLSAGTPAYKKIVALLLEKGEQNRTSTGRKLSLLQCFVCDREIRNRNYYITRHARCHLEDLCYTCSVCGLDFYRSDYYRDHMLQHGVRSSSEETPIASDGKKSMGVKRGRGRGKKVWVPKPLTVPCKICGKGIFNRTYNIKRHAQQHSILEWESILDIAPGSTPDSKPQHQGLSSAGLGSGAQRPIRCGVCGASFKSYTLKRRHMLKHRSGLWCRLCGGKFDSVAALVAHAQSCRKTSTQQEEDSSIHGTQVESQGPIGRRLDQVSTTKKFECPVCSASIINTTQNIKRHMRELHSDGQPHVCSVCGRTYDSYHKLQRHAKSHGDTGGICHICGKVFQTKSALRSHTKLHASPEGMFQCPKCPKSFRFQGRLEKHVKKHAERTEVCPHCDKVYISKIHLHRHISVVHLGVKDYRHKCNQCGAQFFESVQLRDHLAYRHHGIQLYQCKYCNKGFNCRPTMVRHERKEHTNYLPYKCTHCSQCFAEKSKLVAHEMTHTGVSPHKCDMCGKYFTTGSALKAHRNLHLGVKPYVCSVCNKTYLKNWHLQQHVRKAHQPVEVMVYSQSAQEQQEVVTQQPLLDQQGMLDSSCLPTTDTKFLHAPQGAENKFIPGPPPVQGEYHVQGQSEGGGIQPVSQTLIQGQSHGEASSNLHPVAQSILEGHGQISMQHNIVYP